MSNNIVLTINKLISSNQETLISQGIADGKQLKREVNVISYEASGASTLVSITWFFRFTILVIPFWEAISICLNLSTRHSCWLRVGSSPSYSFCRIKQHPPACFRRHHKLLFQIYVSNEAIILVAIAAAVARIVLRTWRGSTYICVEQDHQNEYGCQRRTSPDFDSHLFCQLHWPVAEEKK